MAQQDPRIVQSYEAAGLPAGLFKLPGGRRARAEVRVDGVLLAWDAPRFASVAPALLAVSELRKCVVTLVLGDDLVVVKERGEDLRALLEHVRDVRLARVESDAVAVVWADAEPSRCNLSVVARDWKSATSLAELMGSEEVAAALPVIVETLAAA